jgi:hypothetical protein
MDTIAGEVLRSATGLPDVIAQMRARSASLPYASPPPMPVRAARAIQIIHNPITFQSSNLSVDAALELGNWWGQQQAGDRRDFARFLGLWCSYMRSQGAR